MIYIMARRKNYTSDQLKGYVDGYVRQKNDYSVITATALADYCNSTLHLIPAVTYQTFTRDKMVMQYIDKINKELHKRMLIPSDKGASVHINSFYIEETASAEEIRQRAYEELEKREDLIRELQAEYSKCSKELATTLQEREALLDINKGLTDTIQDQKKEIASLNKEVKEGKTTIATLRKYFKEYLYDPIVIRRVSQKGWISDKKDAIRRCSVNADVISEIDGLYKSACDPEEERISMDTKQEDVSSHSHAIEDEQTIEVVNSQSAVFLSQLRSL